MSSQKQQENSTHTSEIGKFYQGKSLFITGAAGFLGVVLLETLLTCCPDVRRIYILLRAKKGVEPQDRKESIFKKAIFSKLKEKNPDSLNKVLIVSGDIAKENLGMSEDDLMKVSQEVSVVFHCAAAITFFKSLRFMLQQNVIGTYNIIEFCKKLPKFEVLVYTSTAYSNCNLSCVIEERVYKLPFSVGEILELTRNGSDKELDDLFKKCTPPFPNFYTFSKCVSENLILESSTDLPISIIRPSIIMCCLKGRMPGFIEYGSGLVSLSVGVGKGFIRVMRADREKISDIVPADVVVNTHLIAACTHVTQRLPSPSVYNCTGGELAPITWGEFTSELMEMVLKYPLPRSYQRPGVTLCKSPVKYWFFSVLDHYIPAAVIDILLWITGKKLRLLKLYRFYDTCMKSTQYFSLNEWTFRCENFKALSENLNTMDTELFSADLKDFTLSNLRKCIITGSPVYQSTTDNKPYEERARIANWRYVFTSIIKWSVLGVIASIFYAAVF